MKKNGNGTLLLARIDERTVSMEKQIGAIFRKVDNKVDKKTFYSTLSIMIALVAALFVAIQIT